MKNKSNTELKEFSVHFCYGGKSKGDSKYTKTVKGIDREDAERSFKELYKYEEIYSINEVTGTIDCTPSWQNALQISLAVLDGNTKSDARKIALDTLKQMAAVAQQCVDASEDLFNIINQDGESKADGEVIDEIVTYLIKKGMYGNYGKYIGKEFELNNFINTITAIDEEFITYTMRNKKGHQLDGFQRVGIGFMPKIISQLAKQSI